VASVTAEPLQAPRLTSLSPGAGCACKLPQAAPALLGELRAQGLPAVLIGDVVAGESGHVDVYPARSA
jgi:hypothetical protein